MEGTEGVDIGKTSWDSALKPMDIGPRNVGLAFLGGTEHSIGLSRAQVETLRSVLFLLFSLLSLSS